MTYCAGLRLGELARLNLGDIDLEVGTITIRETKFFKSRILPLADSALAALREYLEARRKAKAPQSPGFGLFWHDKGTRATPRTAIAWMLVDILRRAGTKPAKGKTGPRIHDLRHSFVVNRISSGTAPASIRRISSHPRDLSRRASRYPFDARLHHSHAGSFSKQTNVSGRSGHIACSVTEGGQAMKPVDRVPRLLHAFFYEWMVQQRNASAHTGSSYRDTWRLFLGFVAQRRSGR